MLTSPFVPFEHPEEMHAYMDALIERANVERRLGVVHRYGSASNRYGPVVRDWPREIVEELAYVENRVLDTERALRRAQGFER